MSEPKKWPSLSEQVAKLEHDLAKARAARDSLIKALKKFGITVDLSKYTLEDEKPAGTEPAIQHQYETHHIHRPS